MNPMNTRSTSRQALQVLLLLFAALSLLSGGLVLAQTEGGLYALPDSRARVTSSSSLAFLREGRQLVTANMLSNSISVVEPGPGVVLAEIPVGRDPRSVATTPDSTRAVVVNRQDGTISVVDLTTNTVTGTYPVGVLPYGVVTADDTTAYVSLQGSDEVIRVDLATGAITTRIPTDDGPTGLALWGDLLYVTYLWNGRLSLIHLPQAKLIETVSAGQDVGVAQFVGLDAQRGLAYLPQTRLNAGNRALTFDTTLFPVVNVFNLSNLSLGRRAQITLDTADRPVNMPFATVLDSQRRWLYVANAGSNNVSVIDVVTGLAVQSIDTGFNPRGLLLSRDNGTLYIHNMIEGSLMLVDTRTFRVLDEIPVTVLNIPSDIYLGAQLFHTSADPRLSADSWISCASCHFDGQSDGRIWQGYLEGPRNSAMLFGLDEKSLYYRSGSADEIADVELKIRALQGGSGLLFDAPNAALGDPHAGFSPDLDTLSAYLLSLKGPSAPPVTDPVQMAHIERGAEVFAEQDCGSCHSGETFSDGQTHDVGTGGEFVTPTLRWLWLSAPYLHDGSAPTLLDVLILPGDHQLIRTVEIADIEALVAYLNSLPQN